MTDAETKLAAHLRALPAPDREWTRATLRRLVDALPALDRRHTSGDLERVRHDNHTRDLTALYEAIAAIPDVAPQVPRMVAGPCPRCKINACRHQLADAAGYDLSEPDA